MGRHTFTVLLKPCAELFLCCGFWTFARFGICHRGGIPKHGTHIRHLASVERQRLIERSGIPKHATHSRHCGRVERQRLIERCGFIKHVTHVRHLLCVERQRLIERCGIPKHVTHIRHLGRVPLVNWCVKRVQSCKQLRHVRYAGDIPRVGFAVFFHTLTVLLKPCAEFLLCCGLFLDLFVFVF